MSVERTIANFLRIAQEDLKGARLLAGARNEPDRAMTLRPFALLLALFGCAHLGAAGPPGSPAGTPSLFSDGVSSGGLLFVAMLSQQNGVAQLLEIRAGDREATPKALSIFPDTPVGLPSLAESGPVEERNTPWSPAVVAVVLSGAWPPAVMLAWDHRTSSEFGLACTLREPICSQAQSLYVAEWSREVGGWASTSTLPSARDGVQGVAGALWLNGINPDDVGPDGAQLKFHRDTFNPAYTAVTTSRVVSPPGAVRIAGKPWAIWAGADGPQLEVSATRIEDGRVDRFALPDLPGDQVWVGVPEQRAESAMIPVVVFAPETCQGTFLVLSISSEGIGELHRRGFQADRVAGTCGLPRSGHSDRAEVFAWSSGPGQTAAVRCDAGGCRDQVVAGPLGCVLGAAGVLAESTAVLWSCPTGALPLSWIDGEHAP